MCVFLIQLSLFSLSLETLQSVFVPIIRFICSKFKLYLFKMQNNCNWKLASWFCTAVVLFSVFLIELSPSYQCLQTLGHYKMYLSKLLNVFVQISNCICSNSKKIFLVENLVLCSRCSFLLGLSGPCDIAKCICPNC